MLQWFNTWFSLVRILTRQCYSVRLSYFGVCVCVFFILVVLYIRTPYWCIYNKTNAIVLGACAYNLGSLRVSREAFVFPLTSVINMLKKKATLCVWSIYFACMYVFWGTLTGQCFVDEDLHPHVELIYQTAGNNLLFQQVNAPPPICNTQGTVCKLGKSTLEAGHPDPLIYTMKHLCDIQGRGMSLVSLPSCHITLSSWNAGLLNYLNIKLLIHSRIKKFIAK